MPLLLKACLRLALGFVLLAWLLFGLSGRPNWPAGWMFYGILLATIVANLIVLRHDPALLAERMKPVIQPGQAAMDRLLILSFMACYGSWFIVMPLQQRLAGPQDASPVLQALAGLICLTGCGIAITCFAQNSYLSSVVRIQRERGHRLVDQGLYGVVRHPMYLGIILLLEAAPLLLCSTWGTLCGTAAAALLIIRCLHEEALLARELPGYAEYMRKVRWRLLPGLF